MVEGLASAPREPRPCASDNHHRRNSALRRFRGYPDTGVARAVADLYDPGVKAILLAHVGSTLFMAGVIWIVQLVHYPLFAGVGADGFPRYATDHARLISYVVIPAMLVELTTAVVLAFKPDQLGPSAYMGLALVLAVWASTFVLQVPLHAKLSAGFEVEAHRALVATNWIRTILWSLRSGLVLVWLYGAMPDQSP